MIGSILIILGLFFVFTSTLGILLFSNFYSKFHPAGISEALGMPMIMVGLIIKSGFSLVSLKILIIILAMWVTSASASNAIARSYYMRDKK